MTPSTFGNSRRTAAESNRLETNLLTDAEQLTVEITARGPRMTARLNGTLTADATDTKYARGPIALQAAGGLVRYRNVQIREIK